MQEHVPNFGALGNNFSDMLDASGVWVVRVISKPLMCFVKSLSFDVDF